MIKKIFFLLIILFLIFGCTTQETQSDLNNPTNTNQNNESIAFELNNCLSNGETIDDFDNCYLTQAKLTNIIDFCEDISQSKRNECYLSINEELNNNFEIDQELPLEEDQNPISGAFILGNPTLPTTTNFPIIQHENIRFADNDQPLEVVANITNFGPNAKAYIVYKNSYNYGSEGWDRIEMNSIGNNDYFGTIPLDQITPATNFPSKLTNGNFEEWNDESGFAGWRLGWSQAKGSLLETNSTNVYQGNSSLKLTYQPMFFNHIREPDKINRGACTPENSLALSGSISSDPFTIEGDYINFFAGSVDMYKDEEFPSSSDEKVLTTPWGKASGHALGGDPKIRYEDTPLKPRIQLIDSTTGNILNDSVIFPTSTVSSIFKHLEYEWDVSVHQGKTAYIKVIDNTKSPSGLTFDGFIQLAVASDNTISEIEFNNNGQVLENINFEKGNFEGWTVDNPLLWRLSDVNKFFSKLDFEAMASEDRPMRTVARDSWVEDIFGGSPDSPGFWWVGGLTAFNQGYQGDGNRWLVSKFIYHYEEHGLYMNGLLGPVRTLEEESTRRKYVLQTQTDLGQSRFRPGFNVYSQKGTGYVDTYLTNENAIGRYTPTSIYSYTIGRAEDFFATGLDCYGIDCDDTECYCNYANNCEINTHNSWTSNVMQQTPYQFRYKAKTDDGVAAAQVVLWCDYEGPRFGDSGMFNGTKWSLDVEGRGKVYAGMLCKIEPGPEWTECNGIMMVPPNTTQCGDFRFATGQGVSGSGNQLWVDDMSFTPMVAGIQYYILVENDYGQFSNAFPETEKTWNILNGNLNLQSLSKSVRFFAGDEEWTDYIVKFKIKETAPLGYQGYPWSVGSLLFRANDADSFYQLNFNVGHDLIGLTKVVNGRGQHIWLDNPLPTNDSRGISRESPQRDYRPFADHRTTRTSFASGEWYDVELKVQGNKITVNFDGQKVLEEIDSTFTKGKIGLTAYNSNVLFDNVIVTDLAGNTLFSDSFGSQGNWEIDAKEFGNANFITTGQSNDWQKILDITNAPDRTGLIENTFDPVQAKKVAITIFETHKKCNYSSETEGFSEDKSTYYKSIIKNVKIYDTQGNNVLAGTIASDSDEYRAVENWNKYNSFSIDKYSKLDKYSDIGYIVIELNSEATISKLTYEGSLFNANPHCNSALTTLPKAFKVEVLN